MTEEQELLEFNVGQRKAVVSPLNENILISAGAGSGKTKTLSYKVYRLVAHDGLKPSDLLVLTFTNKSAFEMKERIIQQFKKHKGEDSKESLEVVSSHIQTFDSFSMYLVKKYCSLLSLPDNISVADQSILDAKKNEILDEVLKEYYQNQREKVIDSFSKFCTTDDRNIKSFILSIDDELSKILPDRKETFIKDYDENYLTRACFDRFLEEYVNQKKNSLLTYLKQVYFEYKIMDFSDDVDRVIDYLKDKESYNINRYTEFEDDSSDRIVKTTFDLLDQKAEDFYPYIYHMMMDEETKDLFNGSKNRAKNNVKQEHDAIYKKVASYWKDNLLKKDILKYGYDPESQYRQIFSFRDDIHLLLEIIDEMNRRLLEYKKKTNAFTFADIGYMALSLIRDPKYKKAGDEIKNRFKYILVDEYQDTNDIQETFLNCISEKSTLFCVGDAKQSIYRFRNANVGLFMERKKRYEEDPSLGKVIDMNWNYRSSFELLANINRIFDSYMTENHGGISYSETAIDDEGKLIRPQSLDHDPSFGWKNHPDAFYGLGFLGFCSTEPYMDTLLEAKCIIQDIQKKVESGYPVRDRGGFRPARYSDFAVLLRTGKQPFSVYQKLFDEAKIPCNIQTEEHLIQINAILLLQSLINLINAYMQYQKSGEQNLENLRHLFLSVARSYLYGERKGYTDEKLDGLMKDNLYLKDPIMEKVKTFAYDHQDSSLNLIFLDLLKEFSVLDSLPYVGDVVSNVDKIESFYQILLSQEQVGQGLNDFSALFHSISKYSIDLSSTTDVEMENAVKIMTIHGSKGLEFPIVYMPLHYNCLANIRSKVGDFALSLKYGIMLPNYRLGEKIESILKAQYLLNEGSDREEINEHVRIFYVALTRAKEALYLVGNRKPGALGSKKKETLLDMLSCSTHYPQIEDGYVRFLLGKHIITGEEYDLHLEKRKRLLSLYDSKPDFDRIDGTVREASQNSYDELVLSLQESLKDDIIGFELKLAVYFQNTSDHVSEDLKAKIIALLTYKNNGIEDKASFMNQYRIGEDGFRGLFEKHLSSFIKEDSKGNVKINDGDALLSYGSITYGLPPIFYHIVYDESMIHQEDISLSEEEEARENEDYHPLPLSVDDTKIVFAEEKETKGRASKEFVDDEDLEKVKALEYGNLLHSYLELVDFSKKDTSFIENEKDRERIDRVLSLELFSDASKAKIFHEYSYFDDRLKSKGSIDLLLVYSDHIDIVDYKTKHIDDEAYDRQLNVYRRNILTLFPNRKVRMYLLSIIDGVYKEVEEKDD